MNKFTKIIETLFLAFCLLIVIPYTCDYIVDSEPRLASGLMVLMAWIIYGSIKHCVEQEKTIKEKNDTILHFGSRLVK